MPDIKFYCPVCGRKMAIDDQATGLLVHCPDCRTTVTVPRESQPAPLTLEGRAPARPPPSPKPVETPPSAEFEKQKTELARLAAELSTVRIERDNLTKQLAEATTVIASLRQQSADETRRRDEAFSALEKNLATSEAALNAAQKRIDHLSSAQTAEQIANTERDALKKELTRLTDELVSALKERDAQSNECKVTADKLAETKAALAAAQIKMEQLVATAKTAEQTARIEQDTLHNERNHRTIELKIARDELDAQTKQHELALRNLTNRCATLEAEKQATLASAESARLETQGSLDHLAATLAAERSIAAEQQTRFSSELLALREQAQTDRNQTKHEVDHQIERLTTQITELKSKLAASAQSHQADQQAIQRLESEKKQLVLQHAHALAEIDKMHAATRAAPPAPSVAAVTHEKGIKLSDATVYRDPFRLMLRRIFLYATIAAIIIIGAAVLMSRWIPDAEPTATEPTSVGAGVAVPLRETITATLDAPFVIDGLEITASSPRVTPVTLVSVLGSEMTSDESYLVVNLTYSNQSADNDIILYQPWNGSELKDNTGRRSRPALVQQSDVMHEVKGRVLIHTLKPGETISDLILFPWRPGEAESFTFTADPDFRRAGEENRAIPLSSTIIELTIPLEAIEISLRTEVVP